MNQKQIRIILLILITIIGFSLRLYHLDKESIWFDEAITIDDIDQPNLNSAISEVYKIEGKPPLDFILLYFWSKIFGLSVFALRFYYLIFGVISIPLLYLLGKEIFNYKIGLLSSLLLSISTVNILYSQEMRSYSIFVFFTIFSYLFFTKLLKQDILKKSNSDKNYIYLTIINSIAISIHYFGIITIAIQNMIIFAFYKNKKINLKKWIFTQIIPILIFFIYIKPFISILIEFHGGLQNIFINKFLLPYSIAQLGIILFIIPFALLILISLLAFLFSDKLIHLYKKINKNIATPLIVLIWLAGAIIFINTLITPSFITRYSLFIFPIGYILISKGISDIKIKKLQTLILIIILIVSSFFLYTYYSKTTKEQWKDIAYYIQENEKPNEIILFDFRSTSIPFDYYYRGNSSQIGLNETKNSDIKKITNSKTGIWLILSHNWKTQYFYKNQLDSYYNLEFEKQYKGIKLYYYSINGGKQ